MNSPYLDRPLRTIEQARADIEDAHPWGREGCLVFQTKIDKYCGGENVFNIRFSARVIVASDCSKEEAEEIATLMAAAPDLLSELRTCRDVFESVAIYFPDGIFGLADINSRIKAIDELISKAEGRQ